MDIQKLVEKIESDEDFRALVIEAQILFEEKTQLEEKLLAASKKLEHVINEAKKGIRITAAVKPC